MNRKINAGYCSAYGLAKKNGFRGTEEEWLASLKGEPGITTWFGTLAQYQAIQELDPDTYYFILEG